MYSDLRSLLHDDSPDNSANMQSRRRGEPSAAAPGVFMTPNEKNP